MARRGAYDHARPGLTRPSADQRSPDDQVVLRREARRRAEHHDLIGWVDDRVLDRH